MLVNVSTFLHCKKRSCEKTHSYANFCIRFSLNYLLEIAACAAARRAIGTRKGEQDT